MPNAAHGVTAPRLKRLWTATPGSTPWVPVWSSAAALRGLRAMIVVAGLFAFTDKVIGNLQMATFAAFGGFATLVLSSFGGSRRDKVAAHAALAVAGSVLLTIGTAVNSSTVLAAVVTLPVTFAVFFAGVAGPNAAAGVTGALLAYVLAAASPGTISIVPDRLAGWWLASVAGTAAVLLLSPRPGEDRLRAGASQLSASLADVLDAALRGVDLDPILTRGMAAKRELLARFTATPYRPTGLNGPDEALANCVEMLDWCTALVSDTVRERADLRDASRTERRLLEASSTVLRDMAALFAGAGARPDLGWLERCRAESLDWLGQLTPGLPGFSAAARLSFHAHTIAGATLAAGDDALIASRLGDPESMAPERSHWYAPATRLPLRAPQRVRSIAAVALRDASLRSVWFINSARGSIALAVAVAVADLSSVQHGFWVVLGALSVLRTNAASTGSTALRALAGTALGFVIGGALLVAIGSDSTALWVALPVAVFVAAYAPGTAPFAIGQAAFTVTIAVLFNLLAPVGWKVGVVRVEDVAIGCGVSVLAGILFWPRGLAPLVGDDLSDAFRAGASYLQQAVDWASGSRALEPDAGGTASTAALRLDDALRALLAEQGAKHVHKHELWRLVGASMRLRLTAHLVSGLPRDASGVGAARDALAHRTGTLVAWYGRLAELVGKPHGRPPATLEAPRFGPADVPGGTSHTHYGVWLCEHLDHLSEGLGELVGPAEHVAEVRRIPWWR